jgi:hypothetical protein
MKQKADTVRGRTTYRTLSPKRTSFQNGIDSHICERCLEKEESAKRILYECEAIAYLRFRHLTTILWNQMAIMTPLLAESRTSFEV